MLRKFLQLYFLLAVTPIFSQAQKKSIDQKVDSVLKLMTLEDKVSQMNQYNGPWEHTGPITEQGDLLDQVKAGKLGSLLNVNGVPHTKELQELAMQSRLKIPLLFGQDVIHGYRTTFPISLAEAASWDMDAIESAARIAAIEAISWRLSALAVKFQHKENYD